MFLSRSDKLLLLLHYAQQAPGGSRRIHRSAKLAEAINEIASANNLLREFAWNADYQSSRRVDEALAVLDLSGMVAGDNMPTEFVKITEQAESFCRALESRLAKDGRLAEIQAAGKALGEKLGRLSAAS